MDECLNVQIHGECLISLSFAGTAAIQVAKQIGAKIFTTAGSQEKLDFAKDLGADVLINYKEQDFAEIVKKETQGPEIKVGFCWLHVHIHRSSCKSGPRGSCS